MHQHPRPSARTAASAAPSQSTSPRSRDALSTRAFSSQDAMSEPQAVRPSDEKEPGPRDRSNLVVQHFFTKTALIICSSRVSLPPAMSKNGEAKIDRWFNTLIEEADILNQDLHDWRTMDAAIERPSPLVIDVYLDTAQLAPNQTLVAVDDSGKQWDVGETLRRLEASGPSPQGQSSTKLVYERWTISLDDTPAVPSATANEPMPSFYKKGVITCRALCAYARMLPAWKLGRRLSRHDVNGSTTLRPRYRIVGPSLAGKSRFNTLNCSLFPTDDNPTETYRFSPLHCNLGSLNISVTYRTNLDFQVELSERLISAKMAGYERPSSGLSTNSDRERTSLDQDRGSLRGQTSRFSSSFQRPAQRAFESSSRSASYVDRPYSAQAATSSDPVQEFQKDARRIGEETPRASSSRQKEREASQFASSSKESAAIPFQRRPSVSFQPFKAGSLSSSPATANYLSGSPSSSTGKAIGNPLLGHNRKSSLTTLPQQALRNPGVVPEAAAGSSASSSPKPAPIQRYSSSFGNRKSRFPSVSSSRLEEDNTSSGRASVSSNNRNSSTLQEGEGASSGSVQTDEDNIADFLKLLDKNKGLSSFNKTDKASLDANAQRATAQYSKFAKMRDSTAQLSDSMASSLMLQRSSSSSSRALHNVPGMIAGSLSTSSSPGKPISPHTPHMPVIPSRLSNNSVTADHARDRRSRLSGSYVPESIRTESNMRSPGTPSSTAIDIPTSPRQFPSGRRSSSAAQQPRTRVNQIEESEGYGLRSASVPVDDSSLSELMQRDTSGSLRRQREASNAASADDDEPLLFALAD